MNNNDIDFSPKANVNAKFNCREKVITDHQIITPRSSLHILQ